MLPDKLHLLQIGDSIVRKARETLERAIELVEKTPRWGGRVVYGDTDRYTTVQKLTYDKDSVT